MYRQALAVFLLLLLFFYFSQYLRDILLVGYLNGLKKMLNIDKI